MNITKAGPELDTQVAVEVMGWKSKSRGLFWDPEQRRTQMIWDSEIHKARKRLGISDDAVGDGFVFSPSTDMAAAGEVLEHTKLLETNRLWKKSGVWKVGSTYKYEDYLVASAATAPLVICLAALATVKE